MVNEQQEATGRTGSQEEDGFYEAITEDETDRIEHYLTFQKEKVDSRSKVQSFETGLGLFDSAMDGFETGELNVVSGPTGNGKTLFADSIGMRLMQRGMNIAWFSYEVPTEKMIEKYVSNPIYKEFGLYVPMELKTGNIQWLKNKCKEAQLKYSCQAVFIDHLHFLVDMSAKQNMSLNIGAVMRQIKHEIAKGLNMIVFIICHQGQPKEEEPSLENIRDSSFIGQEADNVFIVYRVPDPVPPELENNLKIKGYPRTYANGQAVVKIEKARRSGTYRKKISFEKRGYWLEEVM